MMLTKKILIMVAGGLVLAGCATEPKKIKVEEITAVPTPTVAEENTEKVEEEAKNEETIKEAVTRILVKKYNWEVNKVSVQVNKEVDGFGSGSVGFGEELGGGGWLARKVNGEWEVVWDGNGTVDCKELRTKYQFPDSILKPSFCD